MEVSNMNISEKIYTEMIVMKVSKEQKEKLLAFFGTKKFSGKIREYLLKKIDEEVMSK